MPENEGQRQNLAGGIMINCIERTCRVPFLWTKGEQEFYKKKGFPPPKRCPNCREENKKEKID